MIQSHRRAFRLSGWIAGTAFAVGICSFGAYRLYTHYCRRSRNKQSGAISSSSSSSPRGYVPRWPDDYSQLSIDMWNEYCKEEELHYVTACAPLPISKKTTCKWCGPNSWHLTCACARTRFMQRLRQQDAIQFIKRRDQENASNLPQYSDLLKNPAIYVFRLGQFFSSPLECFEAQGLIKKRLSPHAGIVCAKCNEPHIQEGWWWRNLHICFCCALTTATFGDKTLKPIVPY